MTVRIHIAPDVLPHQPANATWDATATSLEECLAAIEERFPDAPARLVDDTGRVHARLRLYVNGREAPSFRGPLEGNEEVVLETADRLARARVHALARWRGRAAAEDEYERRYGAFVAEGVCGGGLGEAVAFTFAGGAILTGVTGALVVGSGGGLSLMALAVFGLVLFAWGIWNLVGELFD